MITSLFCWKLYARRPLEHTVDKETLERIQSAYTEVNELLNIKFKPKKRPLQKRLLLFQINQHVLKRT